MVDRTTNETVLTKTVISATTYVYIQVANPCNGFRNNVSLSSGEREEVVRDTGNQGQWIRTVNVGFF